VDQQLSAPIGIEIPRRLTLGLRVVVDRTDDDLASLSGR
jgi:hypothetical protein